ncbi:MAG: VIT and VWA domain-containing protein [Dehalococcoidia bacterium]|nr:VIT and VWA domain-containing protein [Dehalococcoidia bacterium]
MFNPRAFENSAPEGVGVLEVAGKEKTGKLNRFIPLKMTIVGGTVGGPLAAMTITHTYGYPRSLCDKVLEAVYRFPLPGDAAVTGVLVAFGDVEIRAELKERKQAEEDYAEAKRQGRQAALVTRESPDVFTLSVAGIKPDEDVTVETSYVQLAKAEGTGWTLRVPLTTAPRYVRADETGSRHASGQPLFSLRDPGHSFSLDILLSEARTIESPTHSLASSDEDGRVRVRLRDGTVIPDRDFVLRWGARQERERAALSVLTYEDAAAGYQYFLAQVAPPASVKKENLVPREIVLLVDHSGSMEGDKWRAADRAVKNFLSTLTPQDTFALGLFHTTCQWLSPQVEAATPGALKKAAKFLDDNHDSGGTELGTALEQALGLRHTGGLRSRHVLVITDAQVSDEGRILRLCEEETRRADRRRISVICIDAAPNSFLTIEMARVGGGVAKFLSSDPLDRDVASSLNELLADWRQPVVTGLRLEVSLPSVQAAGHQTFPTTLSGWSAIDIGDLPAGRATWVAGRVKREGSDPVKFRAIGAGDMVIAAEEETKISSFANPGIKALFGAERVLGLEFLLTSGQDVDDTLQRLGYGSLAALSRQGRRPVYQENLTVDKKQTLTGLLVAESLAYGLLSSVTGFVATRTEAGKVIEGTVPVANALPAGWSSDFASPAMGTSGAGAPQPSQAMAYSVLCEVALPSSTAMPRLRQSIGRGNFPPRVEDLIEVLKQELANVMGRGNIDRLRHEFLVIREQYHHLVKGSQAPTIPYCMPVEEEETPDPTRLREQIDRLMNEAEGLWHEIDRELQELQRIDRVRQDIEDRKDQYTRFTVGTIDQQKQLELTQMTGELRGLMNEVEGLKRELDPMLHDLDLLNRPTSPLRLFAGTPDFQNGHAVLFNERAPVGVYTWLEIRQPEPLQDLLEGQVRIALAVSGLSSQSLDFQLKDVVLAEGKYPLALVVVDGARITLTLADRDGAWSKATPEIEVWLT